MYTHTFIHIYNHANNMNNKLLTTTQTRSHIGSMKIFITICFQSMLQANTHTHAHTHAYKVNHVSGVHNENMHGGLCNFGNVVRMLYVWHYYIVGSLLVTFIWFFMICERKFTRGTLHFAHRPRIQTLSNLHVWIMFSSACVCRWNIFIVCQHDD